MVALLPSGFGAWSLWCLVASVLWWEDWLPPAEHTQVTPSVHIFTGIGGLKPRTWSFKTFGQELHDNLK